MKFGHLINGIEVGLSQLRSWTIEHIKREANFAAHSLAREAIINVVDKVWIEEISNCIYGIVNREQFAPT